MKYLIKSQRDGYYFSGFHSGSGQSIYGKIQEAKIYGDKYTALQDLKKLDQCGQRIIAVTRVGKSRYDDTKKMNH